MKVNAETLEGNRAKLTVEVPHEDFELSMDRAYRGAVKQLNIPGFRKGKAPRYIVERLYGREILLEDAVKEAVPEAFSQALAEVGDQYECLGYPEYDGILTEKGQGLTFTATYDLRPEVRLGEYKGAALPKLPETPAADALDKRLAAMRDRYARIETVDGPATVGDICVIDFLGMIDGEAFDGGSGQNYSLELGSGSFIPGFEDQLIDAKAGDEVPVFVVFPEDYRPEDLAGKEAVFAVTVKEVKRKLLSDMDDEFAKDVSEFETLAELRADLAAKLDKEAKERSQADWESKVVENAAAGAEVALPEGMVSLRADHLMQEFSQRLRQQNLDLDKYLEITGGKLEDAENDMRQRAQDELKTELVLYAVAKAEGLAVSDGDLEEEYARLAGQTDQTVETIKKIYTGSKGMAKSIRENLLMSKTIKRLAELAVATESADAVAAVAAADAEATDLAATAELFEAAAEVADSAEAAAAAIAADLAAAAVPAEAEDLAPAAE